MYQINSYTAIYDILKINVFNMNMILALKKKFERFYNL